MRRNEESKKVVIIGGGAAGLSAAYTLKKRGLSPILFEADDHVDGVSLVKLWMVFQSTLGRISFAPLTCGISGRDVGARR